MQEQLEEMAAGRLTPLEVAKYCHAQPLKYAIQLMQELALQRARQHLLAQQPAAGKAFLTLGRELLQINRQLESGANPNPLMALEHIFSAWHATAGDKDVSHARFNGTAG